MKAETSSLCLPETNGVPHLRLNLLNEEGHGALAPGGGKSDPGSHRRTLPSLLLLAGKWHLLLLLAFLLLACVHPSEATLRLDGLLPLSSTPRCSCCLASQKRPLVTEKPLRLPFKSGQDGAAAVRLGHVAGSYCVKNTHDARLFYFYFPSRSGPKNKDPLLLWLNGGPGVSSAVGLFLENGPYAINRDNATLSWNPHGWDRASNIIYLDQPVGTGLSFSLDDRDSVTSSPAAADQSYLFLLAFLRSHPELRGRPVYLTGESYAGKYIPALAVRVLEGNARKEGPRINLQGIMMGDPWVNAAAQYMSFPDYALASRLITPKQYPHIQKGLMRACQNWSSACGGLYAWNNPDACYKAADACAGVAEIVLLSTLSRGCLYDIRPKCSGQVWCLDTDPVATFLNRPSVRAALGVPSSTPLWQAQWQWGEITFQDEWYRPFSPLVGKILKAGVATLVYNGELDYLCNWIGNWAWISTMRPRGSFRSFTFRKNAKGPVWGTGQRSGLLTFLKVRDAGHFVPKDQPEASLLMLRRFTTKGIL